MNYDSSGGATALPRPISRNNIQKIRNYATFSSSELRIRVSELHADENGRLEISCVSTIPAKVGKNETYADFQVLSVRGEWLFQIEMRALTEFSSKLFLGKTRLTLHMWDKFAIERE